MSTSDNAVRHVKGKLIFRYNRTQSKFVSNKRVECRKWISTYEFTLHHIILENQLTSNVSYHYCYCPL